MPVEVFVPKMTDHMESARLTRWLVQPGSRVDCGQPILEVETDKALAEIESPASGVLTGVAANEGAEVPVGQVIAFIVEPREEAPIAAPLRPAVVSQVRTSDQTQDEGPNELSEVECDAMRCPAERRFAKEHEIRLDPKTLICCRLAGRLTKDRASYTDQVSAKYLLDVPVGETPLDESDCE